MFNVIGIIEIGTENDPRGDDKDLYYVYSSHKNYNSAKAVLDYLNKVEANNPTAIAFGIWNTEEPLFNVAPVNKKGLTPPVVEGKSIYYTQPLVAARKAVEHWNNKHPLTHHTYDLSDDEPVQYYYTLNIAEGDL